MFRIRQRLALPGSVFLATLLAAAAAAQQPPARQCPNANPQKNVYFGDLHTHTAYSFDALSGGVRTTPSDAYAYAKGAPIGLPPYDGARPTRTSKLKRPLDFLAVTDHSEYFGEVRMCTLCAGPHPPPACRRYVNHNPACVALQQSVRDPEEDAQLAFLLWGALLSAPDPTRFPFCGVDGVRCLATAANVWTEIQQAAHAANDPCAFTAFVAYEWTGTPGGVNWHRNVIFRGEHVPGLPFSATDTGPYDDDGTSSATVLWQDLEESCLRDTPGCDVLAIPHNSNLSAASILPVPDSAAEAAQQVRLEPLAEIHQTKGNSECRWGVGTNDELCRFELQSKLFIVGGDPALGPGDPEHPGVPMSAVEQRYPAGDPATGGTFNEFLREVMKGGLYLGDELGVNPYKMGFVGATDTHNSTPGAVEEADYKGQHGVADDTIPKRLSADDPSHGQLENNPGGLTAIWAEENTRDALFDSLRRRESYATSGIRPVVRFFGGWEYPDDLCKGADFVATGYRRGVPMGSDLGPRPAAGGAPRFAMLAMKDPGSDIDARLQRIQIVKGWLGADGELHEKVYDVVPAPPPGSWPGDETYVDLATCDAKPNAPGSDTLCTVWEDPDFDPSESAFYYARVLENPTCRWSTRQCLELGGKADPCWERLRTPANLDEDEPGVVVGYTVQERAWTSAIWYEPPGDER